MTREEHYALGREARRRLSRRLQPQLVLPAHRDPLDILAVQNATRVQELIGERIKRMSVSPFTFYRGTAAIMAADLAAGPHSGILVPSCGDAHGSNFGFYASRPSGILVFDLNDFDEAAWGPWEWDLKRLLVSIVAAGRAAGKSQKVIDEAVLEAVARYAATLASLMQQSPLDRFFTHFEANEAAGHMDKKSREVLQEAIEDAEKRTGERVARRLTKRDDCGRVVFNVEPGSLTMSSLDPRHALELEDRVERYLVSAEAGICELMKHYVPSDAVRRVVGVGSVGTRCYLVAFQAGNGSTLVIQAKEANESVLVQYGGIKQPADLMASIEKYGQGARVVRMQQVLQGVSDPFLGFLRGEESDLYVRQFHDKKGSISMEGLGNRPFVSYAGACAVVLARAHAQTPAAAQIVGYIGDDSRKLGEALLEWSYDYADVSLADYKEFVAANQPAV